SFVNAAARAGPVSFWRMMWSFYCIGATNSRPNCSLQSSGGITQSKEGGTGGPLVICRGAHTSCQVVKGRGPEMSWSVNIGSIAGTAVRIHITFLLFLVWIFGASYWAGGADAAWGGLIFMLLLFACVLAHEFGHIFTARAFGVATPD